MGKRVLPKDKKKPGPNFTIFIDDGEIIIPFKFTTSSNEKTYKDFLNKIHNSQLEIGKVIVKLLLINYELENIFSLIREDSGLFSEWERLKKNIRIKKNDKRKIYEEFIKSDDDLFVKWKLFKNSLANKLKNNDSISFSFFIEKLMESYLDDKEAKLQ